MNKETRTFIFGIIVFAISAAAFVDAIDYLIKSNKSPSGVWMVGIGLNIMGMLFGGNKILKTID